ncbi:MAG: hypothetical protein ACLFSV_05975 [Alkalispirochaeta sp.]
MRNRWLYDVDGVMPDEVGTKVRNGQNVYDEVGDGGTAREARCRLRPSPPAPARLETVLSPGKATPP